MSDALREFLGADLLALYEDGEKLQQTAVAGAFTDYSFIIFPFAKLYEGYLKKLFYRLEVISGQEYESDHWRVGKALNPALEKELREKESVYDRLVEHCGGKEIPDMLWMVWKRGRNQIFHFWPGRNRAVSLEEAKEIVGDISEAMERALVGCQVNLN